MDSSCTWIDLRIRWVLDRLGDVQEHHVQLLPSCYINSLRQPYRPALTHYHSLSHQRVSFVLRLRQSFPEDCARLKLSSARASQAGLKEMMTRRRVRGYLGSRTEKAIQPALNA